MLVPITESDSNSDNQEELKKPVPPARSAGIPNNSIPAPPPLNAIPHVKPLSAKIPTSSQTSTSQTQLKQDEPGLAPATISTSNENNDQKNLTTSKTTGAKTNHTTAAKDLNKQDGRHTLNTPSSSSLSSVKTNRPAKSQKKKKMKKKRSRDDLKPVTAESSLPSVLSRKPSGDDSSTADEDTFDPSNLYPLHCIHCITI